MYFRVHLYRDVGNSDPVKARKVRGIVFNCGYKCRHCFCEYYGKCKYNKIDIWYKIYRLKCDIRHWIFVKFGIDIKTRIFIHRYYTDLSGTITCPHNIPRRYSCYDCEYCGGDRYCLNKERSRIIREGDYKDTEDENGRCKFLTVSEYFKYYDIKTGEIDWDWCEDNAKT